LARDVKAGGESFRVSVTDYWPHYERRLADGPGGRPVVVFSRTDARPVKLWMGDSFETNGVKVTFLSTATQPPQQGNAYGEFVIQVNGAEHVLPVPRDPPAATTAGGYQCQITEFAPNFRVGETSAATDPMNNPAIRVEIVDPEGQTHERLLFAYHPEFNMGHSGQEGSHLDGIDLAYRFERNVYVIRRDDAIVATADFAVDVVGQHGHSAEEHVDAGSEIPVEAGLMLRSGAFAVGATDAFVSGVETAGPSDNDRMPPAVKLSVTDRMGDQMETVVLPWRDEASVSLNGRDVRLGYGPIRIQLPYRLHLDDFVLLTYPGSNNPASFESHVRLYDEGHSIDGRPVRIYMNHPLSYRGFKFFQSSYDEDRRGTVLSVNRDPGKLPTYIGYTMVGVGFLITLTRGIWHRRRRITNGEPKAKRPSMAMARSFLCVLLLVLAPTGALAQAQGEEQDHDHSAPGHSHDPTASFLTPSARDALKVLMVQDYQGRMKPLDTLSRESVMKVSKRHHHLGWEPVDMYVSWLAHPSYWFEQPILRARHPDLRQLLGVPEGTKHLAPSSLLDAQGRYRLAADVETAHRKPAKERSDMQRKLLSFDERVNVFNMAVRGLSLRVFPVPDDPNNRWLSPGEFDQAASAGMTAPVVEEYQAAFTDLYRGLQTLDSNKVLRGAQAISMIQAKYGSTVLPSPRARSAELRLNTLQPFTWATLPYLAAFGILMLAYAWSLVRMKGKRFSLRHPLYALGMVIYLLTVVYHLYGYVLRWIASGRAPLSNGYESLVFISLAIAVVGAYYEFRARRGSVGALAALLTSVILGVAMLPTFDPAISPLVPVLSSFWLIVHVTIITASYGFLGLAAVIALTMLVLHLFKGPDRTTVHYAIIDLNSLHWNVLVAGIAFLSVGTFLGGVWANESWGRYWGWDPKETWALVTILVYAFVLHLRFVDRFNRPLNIAAGSFLSISSVGMTYFGVNYFLSGLHSHAQGDSPGVPGWVYVMAVAMLLLVAGAYVIDGSRSWTREPRVAHH
jgi:cytochrome c-type biogenesis protein CcsB